MASTLLHRRDLVADARARCGPGDDDDETPIGDPDDDEDYGDDDEDEDDEEDTLWTVRQRARTPRPAAAIG